MDVSTLKEFIVLSQELNFTTSAELCHLSQSAFSRHIQALERELGHTLFKRSNSSVSLTEQGRAFLPGVVAAMGHLDEALDALRLSSGVRSSQLSVAYLQDDAEELLLEAYARQLRQFPGISFRLISSWERRMLLLLDKGTADVAVMPLYEPLDDDAWLQLRLHDGTFSLVVPETHSLYGRRSASLCQLGNGEPLLIASRQDHPAQHRFLTRVVKEKAPGAVLRDRVNDIHDLAALPAAGLGACLARTPLLRRLGLDPERLVEITDPELTYHVYALWPRESTNDAIGGFIDILDSLAGA